MKNRKGDKSVPPPLSGPTFAGHHPNLGLLAALTPLLLGIIACAGSAAQSHNGEPPRAGTASTVPTPGATLALPAALSAVPAPPEECSLLLAFAPASPDVECPEDVAGFHVALRTALQARDDGARDSALAAMEHCSSPPGLVRALRADLAPTGCSDVLVEPWLAAHDSREVDAQLYSTMAGLALAARLDRLVRTPPALTPPFDEATLGEFLRTTLASWTMQQAHAIHQTALLGAKLEGYGKGVVAISAGLADLRFVDIMRLAPVPESLAADQELSEEYANALERSLEPRMIRGRDAALVGLKKFAEMGILRDPRLDRARALLSRLFAGRRIDALDRLALPDLPPPDLSDNDRWLAAHLPTFYAWRWLPDFDLADAASLRAMLARGLPPEALRRAESTASDPETLRLLARAHVAFGQVYWQTPAFQKAASLAARINSESFQGESKLIGALAFALRGGPEDATQMMGRGPLLPDGIGDVTALDELAKTQSPTAAEAAFDAALLLALIPLPQPKPEYWSDIATRFERAAGLTADAQLRTSAIAYAAEARATHAAILDRLNSAPDKATLPTQLPLAP